MWDIHVRGFDFKHIKYMDYLKCNHLYIKKKHRTKGFHQDEFYEELR